MSAVRLTADQARRLGISTAGGHTETEDGTPRRRPGGRRRPVPYHTVCVDCGEHLHSAAAETRHLDATRHATYQLVLDFGDNGIGAG